MKLFRSLSIEWWNVIVNILVLIMTVRIGISANRIASQQNNISSQQTNILQQQTEILDRQTTIQNNALEFEKEKQWTNTAQYYRDHINALYDKVSWDDETLTAVHKKIKAGEEVISMDNLDRYVDEFENIGALFCEEKINLTDLRTILKDIIKPVCGNAQINNDYKNKKSWLAALCYVLRPWSEWMAAYVKLDRCWILKD